MEMAGLREDEWSWPIVRQAAEARGSGLRL